MSNVRTGVVPLALLFLLLPTACRRNPVTAPPPKVNAEVLEHIAQGDSHLRESHLYGWRQAEASYQKAYAISPSDEVRKKLFLTRFLILTRQIDEDIPYAEADDVIKGLCAGDAYQRNLCEIAAWVKNGRKAGQLKLSGSVFGAEYPALDSYVTLLMFQATPKLDAFADAQEPELPKSSPLFLYLNPSKMAVMDPAEFEKIYPQFAEGFHYTAESLYQKKKYRLARTYYQKAIELIPDYVNAFVGLGNIYYYVLEDYLQALSYYDSALKKDPSSSTALFGKGVVLQQVGDYQGSNTVLDRMLAVNVARNRWIDGVPDVLYYQGEGNYLKAYNHYLMKDPVKSRELVDLARKSLPESAEISYLSGILFYEDKDLESARKDFLRIIGRGNCDAQLHLGLIYEQMAVANGNQPLPGDKDSADKKAVQYLLGTGACLDSAVGSLSYQIRTMDLSELEPGEQEALKNRMGKKLSDARLSAGSTVEMVIRKISSNPAPEKQAFLKYLNEILSRLRSNLK